MTHHAPLTIHLPLHRLHNTELWASYLPRVPRELYWMVGLGGFLIALSIWGLQNGAIVLASIGFGLSALLILPAILTWLFVIQRWQYRSRVRNEMLDSISWRGDEKVLDVGCGSGIMLNGAAKRLKSGKALGIDIWAPSSGGGDLKLLLQNAKAEAVTDRIEFKEMDARQMSFADSTFDVVFSSGALHHIVSGHAEFDQVMRELVRVLKPGGQIVLWDVTHFIEASASRMKAASLTCEVKSADKFLGYEMSTMIGKKSV